MIKCEICGKQADKHHVVYRSQGGIDFSLNFRCLCSEHHRGKNGPHKNRKLDIQYKLELQSSLKTLLNKDYYMLDELVDLLKINKGMLKRILKEYKVYKEGYKNTDIIYRLMGKKIYTQDMLEEYYDFIAQ